MPASARSALYAAAAAVNGLAGLAAARCAGGACGACFACVIPAAGLVLLAVAGGRRGTKEDGGAAAGPGRAGAPVPRSG
jgi:hypothetical protein